MAVKTMFAKAYLLLLIIFVCVMVSFGLFIYRNTAQIMKTQLGNKCIGIASSVAVLIESDIDGFIKFSEALDTQSDYYKTIRPKLNRIRYENEGIAFLYVEKRVSDTMIMYVLDGENEYDPLFSPPGHTDEMTASEMEAYRTHKPFVPENFVTNDYGTLLTCYAPIYNHSTGEFLGLVGADVSIDQYNAIMGNQFITIMLSIGLLIFLLFLTLVFSSGRMERLIVRDSLTGAYNKPHFMRRLREQMKYSKRRNKPVAVLMADLDYFKKVNDIYGHVFGDVVLCVVSNRVEKALRKSDCFARYGGEEFAAFLPDTDITDAENIAESIRRAVEDTKILNEEHNEYVSITISVGVARCEPQHSAQEALALADKAMYHAKRTRNAIAVYCEDGMK